MNLTKSKFEVLYQLFSADQKLSQRELSKRCNLSLGTVNTAMGALEQDGYIADGEVAQAGIDALQPYKVDNAIIMAAGLSSRFAPISYEKPKGLLKVRGGILIERQIEQLKSAGIDDITVVVGYKQEYFFYLAQKYGVDIVINNDYATKNNNESLWLVKDRLKNTFVCSSDDYFTTNPFEPYVYKAYYAAHFVEGPTEEWCMTTGANGRIVDVKVGGADSWIMMGHVYFDKAFSDTFVKIMEAEHDLPETAGKLWESIYIDHLKDLDMVIRPYEDGVINEFDSLDELREFDGEFMRNVDTDIFNNITSVLGCEIEDISNFYPLKQGLTNLSCHFKAKDQEYVYRHPGVGTEKLVNRAHEKAALELARDLGIDSTFIYEDADEGWKISKFVTNAKNLDPTDDEQLKEAMQIAYKLHHSGAHLDRKFDFVDEGLTYESYLKEYGPIDVPGYYELRDKILKLKEYTTADNRELCLSHNDFFMLNFLVEDDSTINLIDWEYAGMSDEASDFGTFVVCCELSEERANKALEYYFGRTPTLEEKRHFWAYVVFAGWCWYIWSLEKQAEGENVGEYLLLYYTYAVKYIDKVLAMYEA